MYIKSMPYQPAKDFSKYFIGASPLGMLRVVDLYSTSILLLCLAVDMLSKLLVMDPELRLSAEQALAHPYLSTYSDPDDEVIQLFIIIKV